MSDPITDTGPVLVWQGGQPIGYAEHFRVDGGSFTADLHFPEAVPWGESPLTAPLAHLLAAAAAARDMGVPVADSLFLPPDFFAPAVAVGENRSGVPLRRGQLLALHPSGAGFMLADPAGARIIVGLADRDAAPGEAVGVVPTGSFTAPAAPAVADLTGDPVCVAILRAWACRPWKPEHHAALCDRMTELGLEAQVARVRQWARPDGLPDQEWNCLWDWHLWKRRKRGRYLPLWHDQLSKWFGDFENTLCGDGAPDTSPLPF